MSDNSPGHSTSGMPAAPPHPSDDGWLRRAWRRAHNRWRGHTEAEALREAVEELIEESASDSSTGSPATERTLLANVLELRDTHIIDCMVPRADIVAMDVDSDMKQLVETMVERSHSRIPIYRGTLDDTLGMIHIKDVMAKISRNESCPIRDLLRPVQFVAPSMPASRLLSQMRQTRQHMAMVVDEFGGIDGLVTIEDLVELVVGEIDDEHDVPDSPLVVTRPDGTIMADARLPIGDFETRVGKEILTSGERDTIDTLGGYVAHLAGRIPQTGEALKSPCGLTFEVLAADQNRISRVRVRGKLS